MRWLTDAAIRAIRAPARKMPARVTTRFSTRVASFWSEANAPLPSIRSNDCQNASAKPSFGPPLTPARCNTVKIAAAAIVMSSVRTAR